MTGNVNDSPGFMFRANAKNKYNAITPLPYAHGKDKDPHSLFPTKKRMWLITVAITVFVVYIVLTILHSTPSPHLNGNSSAQKQEQTVANQAESGTPSAIPKSPPPGEIIQDKDEPDSETAPGGSELTRDGDRPAFIPSHWLNLAAHKLQFDSLLQELESKPLDPEKDVEFLLEDFNEKEFKTLGLKTRAFKKIFERWERVHIAYDPVEQRPVQPAWVFKRLGSFKPQSRVYEQYRSLIQRFTDKYYSFIRPRYSSLLDAVTNNQGRGMVISAGNHHAKFLQVILPYLRDALNFKLPIEVLYMGDGDLSNENRAKLETVENVKTVNLYDRISDTDEKLKLAGWAGKPISIFSSSFQEVIFVDADVLFLKNPSLVFDEPQYKTSGSLFYTDRSLFPDQGEQAKKIAALLPEPLSDKIKENAYFKHTSGHAQESGVVVLSKAPHLIEFLTVVLLNGHVRDEVTYKIFFGDKETFWFGYELAGVTKYEFQNQPCGSIGPVEQLEERFTEHAPADSKGTICAPQLLHFDYKGRPFWFNGWIMKSKFVGNPKVNKFDGYVQEPGQWQLFEQNIACLSTTRGTQKFTPEEANSLSQIQKYYGLYYPK